MIDIPKEVFNAVEAMVDVPGKREMLLTLRKNDIANSWKVFDEEAERNDFILAPCLLDPIARVLFFPYEVVAIEERARAAARSEALQKASTDGNPN